METITSPTDIDLINKVKLEGCSDSLKTLIDRHTPLAHNIVRRFAPALSATGIPIGDVSDNKEFILYNSVMSFNPDKNVKFSTWYGSRMKYHCLNVIHSSGKYVALADKELQFFIDKNYQENSNDSDGQTNEFVFNILDQIKDKRIKEIFHLRYFESAKKMTWAQIGRRLGISTQTALNLHRKGKKMLLQKLKSDDFSDKI